MAAGLSAEEPARLFPIIQNEKWGYIDKTGKILMEPKFEEARIFSDGMGRVKLNGKFGYVDATGKMVMEMNFTTAYDFSEGLAEACANCDGLTPDGKWGIY